jgi:short-subunit dehydrogenase
MTGKAFQGKAVVITGASLGIGREMALQLADGGAWLALASRNRERLEEAAEACRERGGRCVAIPTDVSDEGQCRDLIARSVKEYGRLDMMVANAGLGMRARFDDLKDLALLRTLMAVNFWGAVYCIHAAMPHLKKAGGRIVVVSSGGGKIPTPTVIGYAASKWAVSGFSDTLRIELRQSGVSVTVAYPEWVATGISTRALRADGTMLGEAVAQEKGAMSAEESARRILKAAAGRKREVMSARLRLGVIMSPIWPWLIDRVGEWQYR